MITQRNSKTPRLLSVRPMVRDDLEALRQPSARGKITKLRESHHAVVRLLAAGLPQKEIAARTGYTISRVSILANDPSCRELLAKYRDQVDESWRESIDEYHALATKNMITAERMISDKLEDADESGELPTTRELLAISRDAADRFGYGKRSTNINVNVDFAKKLEEALARSRSVKLIEAE